MLVANWRRATEIDGTLQEVETDAPPLYDHLLLSGLGPKAVGSVYLLSDEEEEDKQICETREVNPITLGTTGDETGGPALEAGLTDNQVVVSVPLPRFNERMADSTDTLAFILPITADHSPDSPSVRVLEENVASLPKNLFASQHPWRIRMGHYC